MFAQPRCIFPFSFPWALKWSWMSSGRCGVEAGQRGTERICAHRVLLPTRVGMQLCGLAHLHTERRRKEERETQRWEAERERRNECLPGIQSEGGFGCWSQRDFIVPKSASSVCLCVCMFMSNVCALFCFSCREDRVDFLFCLPQPQVKLNVLCS